MKNKSSKDFAVFILTHGRPERVLTYSTLIRQGYTGKIYIIVDDEDPSLQDYIKRFGKKSVIIFSKKEVAKTFDLGDTFTENRGAVFARNACFNIAEKLGITYFLELDDDYSSFAYKFDQYFRYRDKDIMNLDAIFGIFLDYYRSAKKITTLAMAQGGDFIGGSRSAFSESISLKRKAMNTFFCSTERPFKFSGRINEDVNAYVLNGSRGEIFLTSNSTVINQITTQSKEGGMTELYLYFGTYVKSFYTVMFSPSCTVINLMGTEHVRLHHRISWNNAVPKILRESNQSASKTSKERPR